MHGSGLPIMRPSNRIDRKQAGRALSRGPVVRLGRPPSQLRVVVAPDPEELAVKTAGIVESFLRSAPAPVLGLATGASVQPLYRELVSRHREGSLSFASTRAFLLDEYLGLDPDHPQLYRNVVRTELTGQVDFEPVRLHSPDVHAADLEKECARYDRRVSRARVGLQLLGIGRNGHLAFNEPGSALDSRTRVVRLTAGTRAHNSRFFGKPGKVPEWAVTQGLGTILEADHLLVIASGAAKAAAVESALNGPVTDTLPASVLRTHPRVTLMLDPDAAPSPASLARERS